MLRSSFLVLAVVSGVVPLLGHAADRGTCPGGVFMAPAGILTAGDPSPLAERLTLSTAGASIDSTCTDAAAVRLRGGARGTKVRVKWKACVGSGSAVSLRGAITPGCGHLEGRVRANGVTRSFLADRRDERAGGRIVGTVAAVVRGATPETFLLVAATVEARDATGVVVGQGRTTVHGRYVLGGLPAGTYEICAAADGFVARCHVERVTISPTVNGGDRHFQLEPSGPLLRGQVQLADGRPCDRRTGASVTLGGLAPRQVMANAAGEYVLAGIPASGPIALEGRCGARSVFPTDPPSAAQRAGQDAYDLVVPNQPPRIRALYIRDANGRAVRRAAPGAKVTVIVEADDPDGDPLSFAWEGDEVRTKNAPTVAWRLATVEAQNLVRVRVTDDGGASSSDALVVDTSATGDRFLGQVLDTAGQPLAGVVVDVDGATTTTAPDGQFALAVPEADSHAFVVRHRGYAPFAKRYDGTATELRIELRPATLHTVDPSRPIVPRLSNGMALSIPAGALVDATGTPPAGPVRLETTEHDVLDLVNLPGDGAGRDFLGGWHALVIVGALSVELTNGNGQPLNLAPGQSAQVVFPDRMMALMDPAPATLTLYRLDEATSLWEERGTAVRTSAGYAAEVPSFSTWAIGNPTQFKGCLRATVPDWVKLPFGLQVSIPKYLNNDPLADFPVGYKLITQRLFAIQGLPQGRGVTLLISPANSTTTVASVPFGTIDSINSGPQPYPYTGCQDIEIAPPTPGQAEDWMSILESDSPPNAASANVYYELIGAKFTKKTFAQWKVANGFGANDGSVNAAFYNPNELGLGRGATCRTRSGPSGPEVACYVTKYGSVASNPGAALDDAVHHWNAGDTVAMEFSPAPLTAGKRIVKFYIYKPNGQRSTYTYFDTHHTPKYLPEVCGYCHGLSKDWHTDGDMGSNFNVFDAHAYTYSPLAPLAAQQPKLRQLNAMVKLTHPTPDAYTALLDRIYPTGVDTPGAQAVVEPPPPAWASRQTLWNTYTKPLCRTCHMWQDWGNFDTNLLGGPGQARDPQPYLCSGAMPQAQNPTLRLWGQINPFGPNHFLSLLGNPNLCNPTGTLKVAIDPPTVSITAPATNGVLCGPFFCLPAFHTPYVEFGGSTFSATASVQSSATSCCSYAWSSSDGPMGSGATLLFGFDSPGPRIVTATATSAKGFGTRSMAVNATNQPPAVTIIWPTAGATLFRGVTYTLQGSIDDPNQFVEPPCSSLSWSVAGGLAGFPKIGCSRTINFPTTGSQTITLTGTDPYGLTSSTTRTVQVVQAPPGSPPVVSISAPLADQLLQGGTATTLSGTATDPDGNQASITYQWTVTYGSTIVPIGTTPTLSWVPSSAVPVNCGGRPITLRLSATDADGTGSDTRAAFVLYPPC